MAGTPRGHHPGFRGRKAALLRQKLGLIPMNNWSESRLLELSDLVADGHDWIVCGIAMDCSPQEAERQFGKVLLRYGGPPVRKG